MGFNKTPIFTLFGPYSKTVGVTISKLYKNLPLEVHRIMPKVHNNWSTTTKIIAWKRGIHRRQQWCWHIQWLRHNIIQKQNISFKSSKIQVLLSGLVLSSHFINSHLLNQLSYICANKNSTIKIKHKEANTAVLGIIHKYLMTRPHPCETTH